MRLPKKIKKINSEAFSGCTNLTTIVIPNENSVVQLVDATIFSNTPYTQKNKIGYIYVPIDLLEQYRKETNWGFMTEEQFLPIEGLEGSELGYAEE